LRTIRRRKVVSLVPNGLSMLNLIFGFLSIISTVSGEFVNAALFIFLAIIADSFDGKIARKVHATSEMGKEFDSLADLVSFGVASGVLLYEFVLKGVQYGEFFAALPVICAALRLARFNVESNPDYFEGIPAPAFGFFAAAFVLSGITLSLQSTVVVLVVASLSMVTNIKYPTFKHYSMKAFAGIIAFFILLLSLAIIDTRLIVLPFIVYAIGVPFMPRKR
jgi:CDP-diacylglycerol--serine O-phosphatidyltransferase